MTTVVKPISALPAATAFTDADILAFVQIVSGVATTAKGTLGALATKILTDVGGLGAAGAVTPASDVILLLQLVSGVLVPKQTTVSALGIPDPTKVAINTQVGAYTFVPSDAGKLVRHTSATAVAATIAVNATQAFALTQVTTGRQAGAGQITITPATGVTLNIPGGFVSKTRAIGSVYMLHYVSADTWDLTGDLATS